MRNHDAGSVSRRDILSSAIGFLGAVKRLRGWQDTTFSADVKVVNVLATVRDKKGQIVQNLTKDDFTLEEDGRPQTIRYFSRETDLPLTLGLLIDTSMSQRRVLGQERTASYRFLDQVLREDKDKAFVIHFDREVELLEDLTSSRKKLEAALTSLDTPEPQQRGGGGGRYPGGGRRGGGTMLYDAVLLASDEVMKKQHGRKALIVLSDGVDTGSKVSLTSAIESAQRADVLVYSILFADEQGYGQGRGGFGGGGMGRRGGGGYPPRSRYPQNRPDGKKILQQISKETGGSFFEVSKKLPVEQIYSRLEEELRNQYSLGYTPENPSQGFRKISMTVKQKGLLVQARDGYYAGR
jgi:VWFA-related protein